MHIINLFFIYTLLRHNSLYKLYIKNKTIIHLEYITYIETKKTSIKDIVNNKRDCVDYIIEDKYTCGFRLKGTEVKSIRDGNCSIKEAFCYINKSEVFIKNMYIKEYKFGTHNNHDELRDKVLLLNRKEIEKIEKKVNQKGYSMIPLRIMIINGWVKIEIGIAKGKKLYDKRESLKSKDVERDMRRMEKE